MYCVPEVLFGLSLSLPFFVQFFHTMNCGGGREEKRETEQVRNVETKAGRTDKA